MSKIAQMALAVVIGSVLIVGAVWFFVPREVQACSRCQGSTRMLCPACGGKKEVSK